MHTSLSEKQTTRKKKKSIQYSYKKRTNINTGIKYTFQVIVPPVLVRYGTGLQKWSEKVNSQKIKYTQHTLLSFL